MKMLQYIMTVQWGQGRHNIECSFDVAADHLARDIRDHRQRALDDSRKDIQGAKPKVYVWKQVE